MAKIFWSWQNDVDPNRHRWFIMEALEDAIKQLSGGYGIDPAERPELDHDTKDEPGMVEISAAILEKINRSAAFVADLTPLAKMPSGKALPNPNVLIELGWALKMPGWRRLIAVMNTADGYTPNDLPFDIRHRRALVYSLAASSSPSERKAAKKKLTAALVAALKRNLDEHLADVAEVTPITGVETQDGDRSLWRMTENIVSYNDSLGIRGKSQFAIPDRPRAYARLVPSGWKNGIPSATEIEALPHEDAVRPSLLGVSTGDFGFCEQGYMNCWFTGPESEQPREAGNVSMYFDETGEYWAIDSTALFQRKDGRFSVSISGLLRGWQDFLDRTTRVFDKFQAYPFRRLEFGVLGLDNAVWPTEYNLQYPIARKKQLIFERKQRQWTEDAQALILQEVYDNLRDIFGLPKSTAGEALKIVRRE